jgi:putative transposase
MPHTYTSLWTHAMFSTKNRESTLDAKLRPRLFAYMAGIIKSLDADPLLINGPSDHVHLLLMQPARVPLSEILKKAKANSSRWLHEEFGCRFAWQSGYAAFSVSHSNVERVRQYIARQEEHHRRRTYQEEVLAFLKKHGVSYDPRFVFD